MTILLMVAALAAAAPSAEAEQLGLRIARTGAMAAMLPLALAKQSGEIVAEHPELSAADQAALRATAETVGRDGIAKMTAALGHAYAQSLSLADMKAIATFNESPAAAAYRKATPLATQAAMRALGPLDYKADVAAAFCRKTGKLCGVGAKASGR
jgi:CelD/BcsL family acetyltransferase involved in cellulose biosynthesis